MSVGVWAVDPFRVVKRDSCVVQARLEIFQCGLGSHFANAEDVGFDLREGVDESFDGGVGFYWAFGSLFDFVVVDIVGGESDGFLG